MDEKNTGRTEEPSNGNNSKHKTNASLVRMLDKAQEKQLNNLTSKSTETLSTSLTKVVASIFEIKKGQVRACKRIR